MSGIDWKTLTPRVLSASLGIAAADLLADIGVSRDPQIRQHRATAELMAAESLYYEDEREEAIEALTRVAENCADCPRENSMALYFLGHALRRAGRLEDALGIFDQLAGDQLAAAENFPSFDLSQKALRDTVLLAVECRRPDLAERRLRDLARDHPESPYLEEISERLANSSAITPAAREILAAHQPASDN